MLLALTIQIFLIIIVNNNVVMSFKSYYKSSSRNVPLLSLPHMKLVDKNFDALLFDCDGVIAETERDAHRVTFNLAFREKALADEWSVEHYKELLRIGGGKERITFYFDKVGWPEVAASPEFDRKQFVKDIHMLKTNKFQDLVETGALPLRPGVQRLIDEAFANNIPVAVCSTSNEAAVKTIVNTLLGPQRFSKMKIFAGDMVDKKKPSPDIYLLAAKTLAIEPSRCWVVEDSHIGLTAAKAAKMKCVVTKSVYTVDEDFAAADIVCNDLDSGLDGPITVTYLNYKAGVQKSASLTGRNANSDLFAFTPDLGAMFSKIAKGEGSPF